MSPHGFGRKVFCSIYFVFLAVALSYTSLAVAADKNANEIITDKGSILTYVIDTKAPATAAYPSAALNEKSGWQVLDEDDETHTFSGDAVLLNDKLAVVLRKGVLCADVYARNAAGYVSRGSLAPRGVRGDQVKGLETVKIVDNQTGAVCVAGTFATAQGKSFVVDFCLTTGQVFVELKPHAECDAIMVDIPAEFVVVPDFFGDDLVYATKNIRRPVVGLPAENFYMHLVDHGNSVVTCLWQSNGRNTRLLASGNVLTSEMDCVDGKTLWVAFSESPQIWHSQAASPTSAGADSPLQWTAPFPGKWRADLFESSEVATSTEFLGQAPSGEKVSQSSRLCATCWFDGSRAMVRIKDAASAAGAGSTGGKSPVTIITYSIDRTQETPLNVYGLVDLMRGTLGMGACQYILDVEGMDAQASPTPALVMEWVEKQFEKKKEVHAKDDISKRCRMMVDNIVKGEQRITRYKGFAVSARKLVTAEKSDTSARQDLLRIIDDIDQVIAQTASLRANQETATAEAQHVVELIGKDGGYAECQKTGQLLRAQGAAQDRTLAKCRTDVRRLKQYVLIAVEEDSKSTGFMRPIREQADAVLSGKQPSP